MNEPTAPFSQMDADILAIMPMLSGSIAKVYMTLGAFEADPIAPSQADLMNYARVSRPSVSEAVQFLCTHELARCFVGEDGTLRYRSIRYFRYAAREPVSVRERVLQPVSLTVSVSTPGMLGQVDSRSQTDVKKFFTSNPIITTDSSSSKKEERESNKKKQKSPAQKILQTAGIFGKVLQEDFIALVSEETARAWADWVATYDGKSNPQGIAINALREDPDAQPYIKREPEQRVTRGGYKLEALQRQCGTMAHKLWARSNGGCENCGIAPKEGQSYETA